LLCLKKKVDKAFLQGDKVPYNNLEKKFSPIGNLPNDLIDGRLYYEGYQEKFPAQGEWLRIKGLIC